MGIFKQMIKDNNNKMLDIVCESIVNIDKSLKDDLVPSDVSRTIPTIKFVDAVAVRCFIRNTKYVTLIINSLNNNLIMYKGKTKGEDGYWEASNHYKTMYGLGSLDDNKVIEEITKDINKVLK
jgi:hypothetical protein